MRRVLAVLGTALALILGGGLLTPAQADTKLPVPYNFIIDAVGSGLSGAENAPGANDWACKPTAAHPLPVVLVHGTAGNAVTNWQTYAPLLKNEGYCVYAFTFGTNPAIGAAEPLFGGLTSMEGSVKTLSAFVDRVRTSTGAAKVDLVGHSQGTLLSGYYVKSHGGATKVNAVVSLAPLWHGTNLLGLNNLYELGKAFGFQSQVDGQLLTYCAACREMLADSPFIAALRSGTGIKVPGVKYTNIVTQFDEIAFPYTTGIEPGMTNLVVQNGCLLDLADHLAIASERRASVMVLNALDPAHPRSVPCTISLPVLGSIG